jgi:phage FluMu protein Com
MKQQADKAVVICKRCKTKLVIDNNFSDVKKSNEFFIRSITVAKITPNSKVLEIRCRNCKEWNQFDLTGVI